MARGKQDRDKPIDRLRALEARGIRLSRNANFELFREPSNRRALRLHRYLEGLAKEIRRGHEEGALSVGLEETPGGALRLRLRREDLALVQTATLEPAEMEALAERDGVEDALRDAGLAEDLRDAGVL
ncbi:MAG: hypothetical protein ACQEXJ_20575 [Myxococcota bacterium]